MRAFLTGVSGFVGSHLAEKLHSIGHRVTSTCRSSSRVPELSCELELSRIDLLDPDEVTACVAGADVIYHVAGATSGGSQEDFDRANALTTRVLLEARERAAPEALFVLVSSLSAAGPGDREGRPVGPYGRSKLLAEKLVRRTDNWVIVRPPAVFGRRDSATAPLFRLALAGLVFTPADREATIAMVYVDDLVELLAMLPRCADARGEILVPAYPDLLTWPELADLLGRAAGRRVLRIGVPAPLVRLAGRLSEIVAALPGRSPAVFDRHKSIEFLATGWKLDDGLTEQLTGWVPSTPILEAMRRTMDFYSGEEGNRE